MATYVVRSKGKSYTVDVVDQAGGGATVTVEDESFQVEFVSGEGNAVSAGAPATPASSPAAGPVVGTSAPAGPGPAPVAQPAHVGAGSVTAPIPGKVIAVHVAAGATVAAGETVITLEAMKMENAIAAPISGTVKEVRRW